MIDIQKLKALAEAANVRTSNADADEEAMFSFECAFAPAAVLELIAELDRVRESHQQVCENYNKVSYASEERGIQLDQLKAENESLRQQLAIPSDVLADAEALRRDAERYRWLRGDASAGKVDFCIMRKHWREDALSEVLTLGEADQQIDAAMGKEAQS